MGVGAVVLDWCGKLVKSCWRFEGSIPLSDALESQSACEVLSRERVTYCIYVISLSSPSRTKTWFSSTAVRMALEVEKTDESWRATGFWETRAHTRWRLVDLRKRRH